MDGCAKCCETFELRGLPGSVLVQVVLCLAISIAMGRLTGRGAHRVPADLR